MAETVLFPSHLTRLPLTVSHLYHRLDNYIIYHCMVLPTKKIADMTVEVTCAKNAMVFKWIDDPQMGAWLAFTR